jgi:hypothetical protein
VVAVKVLFLTRTGPLGPSSRYRVYQLLPLLTGIQAEVSPAIEGSLRATWQRRRADLDRIGEFDAVFVQKGIFPGLSSGFERRFAAKKPLIFDFDDAIWLRRRGGSRVAHVLHHERTVQDVLRCATAVIAGNDYLAEYASRFNRNVTVVPTAIDAAKYPAGGGATVGWIGSRTTLPYLKPLKPVFTKLGIVPRVIAAGDPGFRVDFRPWTLETELTELAQIGIGISPLPDAPWERGKCGVKLLQYMACGIPVVASPVGVHNQIVRHGVNGYLAGELVEWESYLRELIANPTLRQQFGDAGRSLVRQRYDIHQATTRVASVLKP